MNAVVIHVFPRATTFSPGFRAAVSRSLGKQSMAYKGVTFVLTRRDVPRVTLRGLDAKLPALFDKELEVGSVFLLAPIPSPLKALKGWYSDTAYPNTACCVDPKGEMRDDGPSISVNGSRLGDVVDLYKLVLTGRLSPAGRAR